MMPTLASTGAPRPPVDLIAASLLTSAEGAEVHFVARDGQRLRLVADEPTARALAESVWRALETRLA